jgi:alpha-tubulin suppressor-like RCC1 family protein
MTLPWLRPVPLALLAMLSSCSGPEDGATQPHPIPQAASIDVELSDDSIPAGQPASIIAIPRDSAGNFLDHRPIRWTSSDTSIATVSPTGLIATRHPGLATFTAAVDSVSQSVSLKVLVPVARVQFITAPDTMSVGDTLRLQALLLDANDIPIPGRLPHWATTTLLISSVDSSGLLTILAPGTFFVSASAEGHQASAPFSSFVRFMSIGAGSARTCGGADDGRLYCWGSNYQGELGSCGVTCRQPVPVATPAGGFTSLALGQSHSCGVAGGQGICWGSNYVGELGRGNRSSALETPGVVTGALNFSSIVNGSQFSCGLDQAGTAWCWGSGRDGRLANGDVFGCAGSTSLCVEYPTSIPGVTFTTITAGDRHACALDASGTVFCWGDGRIGQLGIPDTLAPGCLLVLGQVIDGCSNVPVAVRTTQTFTALSSGQYHTCGLTTGGAVYCWGINDLGELGDGTTVSRDSAAQVSGLPPVAAISAGGFTTCALASDGTAFCWGKNYDGNLGSTSSETCQEFGGFIGPCSTTPLPVTGSLKFARLSPGYSHTCGLATDGLLYCWGRNAAGELGSPLPPASVNPIVVYGQQ